MRTARDVHQPVSAKTRRRSGTRRGRSLAFLMRKFGNFKLNSPSGRLNWSGKPTRKQRRRETLRCARIFYVEAFCLYSKLVADHWGRLAGAVSSGFLGKCPLKFKARALETEGEAWLSL